MTNITGSLQYLNNDKLITSKHTFKGYLICIYNVIVILLWAYYNMFLK